MTKRIDIILQIAVNTLEGNNMYNYQAEGINSSYSYFYSFIPLSKYIYSTIKDFKEGRNPFLKIESVCSCLIWISVPSFKKYGLSALLEGVIDRTRPSSWKKCKSMLKIICRPTSADANEKMNKITFNINGMNRIPVFSHFYETEKAMNYTVVRKEFIQKKMLNGFTSFLLSMGTNVPISAKIKRNLVVNTEKSHDKVSMANNNPKGFSELNEKWKNKYTRYKKYFPPELVYHGNFKRTSQSKINNTEITNHINTKLMRTHQILKTESPSKYVFEEATKLNVACDTDDICENKVEQENLKIPAIKTVTKPKIEIQCKISSMKRIRGDEVQDLSVETEKSKSIMSLYDAFKIQFPLNNNIIMSRTIIVCNAKPLQNELITETLKDHSTTNKDTIYNVAIMKEMQEKNEINFSGKISEMFGYTSQSLKESEVDFQSFDMNLVLTENSSEYETGNSYSYKNPSDHERKLQMIYKNKTTTDPVSENFYTLGSGVEFDTVRSYSINTIVDQDPIPIINHKIESHMDLSSREIGSLMSIFPVSKKTKNDDRNSLLLMKTVKEINDVNKDPSVFDREISKKLKHSTKNSAKLTDSIPHRGSGLPSSNVKNNKLKNETRSQEMRSNSATDYYINDQSTLADWNMNFDTNGGTNVDDDANPRNPMTNDERLSRIQDIIFKHKNPQ